MIICDLQPVAGTSRRRDSFAATWKAQGLTHVGTDVSGCLRRGMSVRRWPGAHRSRLKIR
jgi:hypothetical protein